MILPDDVDEKIEFWVGESDTESDNETDGETVIGQGIRPWKTTKLVDSRSLRNRVRSERESGSTNNGGATRRRRILGNGLLAVQSETRGHSRNQHAFELKLETRRATRSEEGKGTPPFIGVRRNPMEKGSVSRWGNIGGLSDTVRATMPGIHQGTDESFCRAASLCFRTPLNQRTHNPPPAVPQAWVGMRDAGGCVRRDWDLICGQTTCRLDSWALPQFHPDKRKEFQRLHREP
jgi:hypothetical protein